MLLSNTAVDLCKPNFGDFFRLDSYSYSENQVAKKISFSNSSESISFDSISVLEGENELIEILKKNYFYPNEESFNDNSDLSNWMERYYTNFTSVIKKLSKNIDQSIFSDMLASLFELDSEITFNSRKKLAFDLISDKKSKIREAAISGLFYFADKEDLSLIKLNEENENLSSLKLLYKELSNFLS